MFVFSYLLHLKDPLLFSLKIETSNGQRGSLQTFKTLSLETFIFIITICLQQAVHLKQPR